jgi:hypothetical protein
MQGSMCDINTTVSTEISGENQSCMFDVGPKHESIFATVWDPEYGIVAPNGPNLVSVKMT